MYEPLYVSFDAYPRVIPRVRVRGVMALFLAVSILWALAWLLYRAWQVCQTPNDVLVEKLGLDIPPSPEVTLEEVTAREIHIAWKQPDFHNSIHKNIIQLNGVKVGESRRAETAVEILNLVPGTIYHICVLSVSAANFQTPSAILHVRTKSLPSSQAQQSATVGGPTVRATIPKSTAGLPAPSAPLVPREQSGSQLQAKRNPAGRKPSPSTNGSDASHSQTSDVQKNATGDDSDETMEQLAEKLKYLQHESETVDKQVTDEEEEHIALLKDLEAQRDELRKRVKEKDEASGDLKKQVYKLETVNRSVQGERSKRDRILQQKETERRKRRNDISRWLDRIAQMTKDAEHAKEERSRVEEEARKRGAQIREKISKEQAEMKTIDDAIQDKGGRIKKLEEERKKLQGGDNEDGNNELDRIDNERARQWEMKLNNLNVRYVTLVNLHAQVQRQYHEAQEHLRWLVSQQSAASGPFGLPVADLDMTSTATLRPRRHRGSLASNFSPPMNFTGVDPSFSSAVNYNPTSTGSPTFVSNPAFFNVNNGMTIPTLSDPPENLRGELDASLNNPQMSPRADLLLPSDLLGDEESPELPGPASGTRFSEVEPPTGTHDGPPSPGSPPNRPASMFASPHEEKNLDLETDSQSHLGSAVDATKNASRRFSGLFGLNRPRGKTLADEPPSLGALKTGQSQSFPRNVDDMEPIGSRRRRLSYTGHWNHPMTLLSRSNTASIATDNSSDHLHSRRAALSSIFSPGKLGFGSTGGLKSSENSDTGAGYNQFSPRHDPIDPSYILGAVRRGSPSPRPSSTSFDKQLPHPSTDNQYFGWPSVERTGHRSPLGFDWTSPSTWSKTPSRRPSSQFDSSSHVPLGLTGEPDYVEDPSEKPHRPLQAPIGTRPSSSHRPITPKLNPAAPSFRTVPGKKSVKGRGKEEKDSLQDAPFDYYYDGESPVDSRDSHSLNGDSEPLERVSSGTSMDNTQPKDSFIRKITRKSSSGKFGSWKDRSGLFSKKSDLGDGEDGGSETQLGKSLDSNTSSTPSVDKSSKSGLGFFGRKSRRTDRAASESSERASEAGDEDLSEESIPS